MGPPRVLLLVALVLLAGCNRPAPTTSTIPSPQEDTGVVHGWVTDMAARPLRNAVVNLTRDGALVQAATTDVGGAYAFAQVPPGVYEVQAIRGGYEPSLPQSAVVEAGKQVQIDFLLEPLLPPPPYKTSIHSRLTIQAGACPDPNCLEHEKTGNWTALYDANETRYGPLQTLIVEAFWQPTVPGCDVYLRHDAYSPQRPQPSATNASDPFRWRGNASLSPTRLVIHREGHPDAMHSTNRTLLNGGQAIITSGTWRSYTWALPQPGSLGCAVDLKVDLWISAFHGLAAPPGWTINPPS